MHFCFDSDGGFLTIRDEINTPHIGAFSPALGSHILSYADDDTANERSTCDQDLPDSTDSSVPHVRYKIFCFKFNTF